MNTCTLISIDTHHQCRTDWAHTIDRTSALACDEKECSMPESIVQSLEAPKFYLDFPPAGAMLLRKAATIHADLSAVSWLPPLLCAT